MLKIKSFKITDGEGINELLKEHRLAEGAHILVSEGNLAIPYEDGLEPTPTQEIVRNLELKNKMLMERDIIEHSQRVLEIQIETIKAEIEEVEREPKLGKAKYQQKDEVKKLTNILTQMERQVPMNKGEIKRINANIRVFDEKVEALKAKA